MSNWGFSILESNHWRSVSFPNQLQLVSLKAWNMKWLIPEQTYQVCHKFLTGASNPLLKLPCGLDAQRCRDTLLLLIFATELATVIRQRIEQQASWAIIRSNLKLENTWSVSSTSLAFSISKWLVSSQGDSVPDVSVPTLPQCFRLHSHCQAQPFCHVLEKCSTVDILSRQPYFMIFLCLMPIRDQ